MFDEKDKTRILEEFNAEFSGERLEKAWHHLYVPVAVVLEMYAVVRSCWKTWRQGGITWRDTFYSLDSLEEARYRTSAD